MVPSAIEGNQSTVVMNSIAWYAVGALIALLLFAYLLYSLIKPEKF
jgi:K+-transporting ATPase KdpF subunit